MKEKIKVIIADDIDIIAKSNKKIAMDNPNIEVIGIALNGKELYDMILKLKPDLVITDNKMPAINGIDVIEKVDVLEVKDKPNFILVTGDNNFELNKRCRELNVFGIVGKTAREKELAYLINEYMELEENKEIDIEKNEDLTQNNNEKIKEKQTGLLKGILNKIKKRV